MRFEWLRRKSVNFFRLQLVVWLMFAYQLMLQMIPDDLYLEDGNLTNVRFSVPVQLECADSGDRVIDTASILQQQQIVRSSQEQVKLTAKLFGLVPVKCLTANIVDSQDLWVSGENVGFYVETEGVLVLGTGDVADANSTNYSPSLNVLKSGDYICGVDDTVISTKEDLIKAINDAQGKSVVLSVRRRGELLQLYIQPRPDDEGVYRIGAWVRDDLAGIGTLTYIDQAGHFGALGHCISDVDTGVQLDVAKGNLYDSTVIDIVKGSKGEPGQLSGVINYREESKLGTIWTNSREGVYGAIEETSSLWKQCVTYPVGYKQEIETSDAQILCQVDGEIACYDIIITEIHYQENQENKSILFEVKDPQLLSLTGGIVQGMSGSPIIQNGKVVGAVTHVFVNDPTKGYGIFIEDMLEHT